MGMLMPRPRNSGIMSVMCWRTQMLASATSVRGTKTTSWGARTTVSFTPTFVVCTRSSLRAMNLFSEPPVRTRITLS